MPMFDRRTTLVGGAALLAGCAAGPGGGNAARGNRDRFVTVEGTALRLGDRPYRFVGANLWYGAYLGSTGATGDRDRLRRELDALQAIGVDNLRVLGGSELSPLRNSLDPAFRGRSADYNAELLAGLDYLLVEMARRGMRAVIYLTNFWEWSGGMMTYLHWVNGGRYLNMNDPAHPWPAFPDFNAAFYSTAPAVELYHAYVRAIVTRTNTISGVRYADDPSIMAWQLANEPRPGGSDAVAVPNLPAFQGWIERTAGLIKTLDPNHLVSTGSEGLKGSIERPDVVLAAHRPAVIDYLTAHIWPLNWSWVKADDLAGTHAAGAEKVADYIAQHEGFARTLGKPLVIEEFGYPRDDEAYDPGTPTTWKDRFYRQIYAAVEASAAAGGPLVGSNFWAWGGEARAAHPDHRFRTGDRAYVGDPPHEPQGWYSVFAGDASTREIVTQHARALRTGASAS